jgi:hypothetical protein
METAEVKLRSGLRPAKAYAYIQDPGHGWIEVRRSELVALGISGKISAYSYRDFQVAYLEEDRDAGLWVDAWCDLGVDVRPLIRSKHVSRESKIRSYPRYT